MNSKRYLTLLAAGAISLGIGDWVGLPDIFNTEFFETSQASAAKKKTSRKSTKKKKSTSTKRSTSKTYSKSTSRKKTSKKYSRTRKKRSTVTAPRTTTTTPPAEKPSNDSLTLSVNERLIKLIPKSHNPGGLRVNSVKTDTNNLTAVISLNENFTYLPINKEYIQQLESQAKEAMPDSLADYSVDLRVSGKPLSYYINSIDKLPAKYRTNIPFVRPAQPLTPITKGMLGDNVALWHSHGRYYKPANDNWYWQRPLLFQSIEDTYTLGYILPYVVPMLENAGAYVMLPRERDINPIEVIVDNDKPDDGLVLYSQDTYFETNGHHKWQTGEGEGFIYDLPDFRDTENPFENGTYRVVKTSKSGSPSTAAWVADIPESREYAIYVSYKSLPNSSEDARYTINYDGGSEDILVNQKMGGGTWIYLGTYPLAEGYDPENPTVVLTSRTEKGGETVVTADAVKIGGGMGNIARSPRRSDVLWNNVIETTDTDSLAYDDMVAEIAEATGQPIATDNPFRNEEVQKTIKPEPIFKTSGLPRWLEGARYWLQWAGMPDAVYSPYAGTDDYKDDYTCRGLWVNYLAGGSRVLPKEEGLGIPIDAAMALHSDAGKRADDSFIGTLGIYYTNGNGNYADGTPRKNSRTMTDMLMRQITGDIRAKFEPEWTRRSMWDKSYLEARTPEVPTTLIELLSHQNFGDMQYGLDPRFRFTVGRSIYKALARFIGERKDRKVVIQPLPVKDFAIQKTGKNTYRLSWQPTPDELEPTAMPTGYIIMERSGEDMSFNKIGESSKPHFEIQAADDEIHSFRIIAFNEGGRSFPSETLSLRHVTGDSKPILIINGFTRVSAPAIVKDGDYAGFDGAKDFGVPYIEDYSFTGYQTEYHRSAGDGFGKSSDKYVSSVIAGNSFDYPYIHGESIAEAGRGFVSASVGAVERGTVNLSDYKTIDLILGKQKATTVGRGNNGVEFFTFPKNLRNALKAFLDKGGDLIVSGQYVASDLLDSRNDNDAARWGEEVLCVTVPESASSTQAGRIDGVASPLTSTLKSRRYAYSNT
ncbi:MAG: hypothetical protein K2N25_02560, partial [Muribaculaceae bacterium]|nr:hypothetical protein [Muribaculaceae bacterium]